LKKAPISLVKDEVTQTLPNKLIKSFIHIFVGLAVFILLPQRANACPESEKTIQVSEPATKKSVKNISENHSLKDPCSSDHENQSDEHWMNTFHETISDSVYQSAVWFDNFFLDEDMKQSNPEATARIRFGWEPKSRDFSEVDIRFRIKVKLPHFENKVDLILSDDDDSTQEDLPLETVNTASEIEETKFAAAVRYTHKKNKNRLLESRIGISGGDIFLKARHKRMYTWQNTHSLRIEPSVYYYLKDGLGAKLLLEYNYQANEKSQYRINYSVRGSESFSGLRWKHGFYNLTQLQSNSATIAGLQIEGERNGENGFIIDKYTLSYRYRFNAIRSWLFFEVEPFVEWAEIENYSTSPGIALRVEGFFSKD